jgi:hypothetical protein
MKTVNTVQEFRLSYLCRSDFICGYNVFPLAHPGGGNGRAAGVVVQ